MYIYVKFFIHVPTSYMHHRFAFIELGGRTKTLLQNCFGALKSDDEIKIIYVLVFLASHIIKLPGGIIC